MWKTCGDKGNRPPAVESGGSFTFRIIPQDDIIVNDIVERPARLSFRALYSRVPVAAWKHNCRSTQALTATTASILR